jgi:FlaA1/EpsC-like NDP-sugar epimerase
MIQNYLRNSAYKYASKWLVLAIDVFIILIAFIMSYLIRFNLTIDFDAIQLLSQLPLVCLIAILAFVITGSYKGVIRHTGVRDVYNIFNAICLSSILTILIVLVKQQSNMFVGFTIPLSIIIIHSLIGFIGLTAARYVFKSLYNSIIMGKLNVSKNVIIYGAGESGILTHSALTNYTKSNVRVVGYIDNDQQKVGKMINGVKVFGKKELTESFILKRDI